MNIIDIRNLNFQNILNNINIGVKEKSFIVISGPNKCGKTTLIKLLNRNISSEGTIFYQNTDINKIDLTTFYKSISSVVPLDEENFIFKTVEKELLFILDNLATKNSVKKSRYKEMLKLFDLEDYSQQDPNKLKNEVKTRLLLAMAVISKPKVLLLDDICSDMNKNDTIKTVKILKSLQKNYNMTIIMTTSNLNEVINTDYLYIMSKGKIVMEDRPLNILKRDNELNKLSLNVPFMIDLSVKLEDYNLINRVVMDMDLLVSALWK